MPHFDLSKFTCIFEEHTNETLRMVPLFNKVQNVDTLKQQTEIYIENSDSNLGLVVQES